MNNLCIPNDHTWLGAAFGRCLIEDITTGSRVSNKKIKRQTGFETSLYGGVGLLLVITAGPHFSLF